MHFYYSLQKLQFTFRSYGPFSQHLLERSLQERYTSSVQQ